MAGHVMTFAEVLRDEIEYLDRAPLADDELQWRFLRDDIYDPDSFSGTIRAARTIRSRFALLESAIAPDTQKATAQTLTDALNRAVGDVGFFEKLLQYDDFIAIVWTSPRLLAAILTTPRLGALFFETDSTRVQRLIDERARLREVIDDGDVLERLLGTSDVAGAVLTQPKLLGPLVRSATIRHYLQQPAYASRLAEHFGGPHRFWPFGPRARAKTATDVAAGDADTIMQILSPGSTDYRIDCDPEGSERWATALLVEAAYHDYLHDHFEEKVLLAYQHRRNRVALCLSGGGIRSATFNLGVLQGLARNGVLRSVDYLSTISGGGYIGSWLSSWMRRHPSGAAGVIDELGTLSSDPAKPEPEPISHLREYSNYLAPRGGLMSVDTWTIFATYVRNLLLNWLMLIPPIAAFLILPRLYEQQLLTRAAPNSWRIAAAVLLPFSMIILAFIRPVGRAERGEHKTTATLRSERIRVWLFLLPGFAAALVAANAYAVDPSILRFDYVWRGIRVSIPVFWFLVADVLSSALYLVCHYITMKKADDDAFNRLSTKRGWHRLRELFRREFAGKVLLELSGAAIAAVAGGTLLQFGATHLFKTPISMNGEYIDSVERFTLFAVPIFIGVLFLQSSLLVGVVTIVSGDMEREWWSRAAAMMLLGACAWTAVGALSLMTPFLITQLPRTIAALGGATTLYSALRGYRDSSGTKEKRKSDLPLAIAAAVATIFCIGAIALLVDVLAPGLKTPQQHPPDKSNVTLNAHFVAPDGYALHVEKPTKPESAWHTITTAESGSRWHLDALHGSTNLLPIALLAVVIALIAGTLLDVNLYSMHGMYRNRLIRAYLGASRWFRRPNALTGFDPQDNLQMYQLLPDFLWSGSFTDFDGFIQALNGTPSILSFLPARVRDRVTRYTPSERNETLSMVFGAFNQVMQEVDFATALPARRTLALMRKNRQYLANAFPDWIKQAGEKQPPLHILGVTLNLVGGDNLAWQQRKAESFTVSPLHSGSAASKRLGFRRSNEYGGPVGISLGTAMAVSGAAVSPNMGYNSSSFVTFIMTLFNARLGWWLGNPGAKGEKTYRKRGPTMALRPLLSEAFGMTNDQSSYVFLSDGGHFENLGLYEMVRRRSRYIIVCDAAGDEKYEYGELANAVRKVRVDFGIPIEFKKFCIGPDPNDPLKARQAAHCAVGTIKYRAIDKRRHKSRGVRNGVFFYIKPAVYDDCPVDVKNYAREGKPFPQESTADQFFDETQFESYRELGSHTLKAMAGESHTSIRTFLAHVIRYLRAHNRKHSC